MTALALNFGLANVRQHAPDNLADRKRSIGFAVHEVPPSSRPENGDDEAEMKSPQNGRNSGAVRHQTRTTLTHSFKVHFTEQAKVVARRAGQSPETVDLYRQAGVPQSWAQMVEYCRIHKGFALDVIEAMGIDIDQNREAYAMFLALQAKVRGE